MDSQGTAANYHVQSIIETCTRLGLDRTGLLKDSGIEESELKQANQRQPGHKVLRLWQVAEARSNNVLLPLHVGARATSLHRSALNTMIEACATLGQALSFGIRYQHLTQNIVKSALHFNADQGIMSVENNGFDEVMVRPQIERQLSFVVAVALNLLEAPMNQTKQVEVQLKSSPRTDPCHYEAVLGVPVRFGCEYDQLVFPKSMLDLNNFSSNGEVCSSLLSVVQQHEKALACGSNIKEQIRQLIADNLECTHIEVDTVARDLNMSVRTLQRRLKKQGTHFSEVYDEVRKHRAMELIDTPTLSLSEIGFRLGFHHITGFYNAFHRWTGVAPKQYRQTLTQSRMGYHSS